ncbi:Protein of unknown function DUF573 [Macleaya cordata]|uniref:Glabrous enhancer-binding protein-like DBD domain-containing protein n=1 Tax=Macleaya cordata TaxID=56857 RepID=A0A200R9U5_MACCD|nr:Protein of unknown function DUF573 [Macleaya cordata]
MSTVAEVPSKRKKLSSGEKHRESSPESPEKKPTPSSDRKPRFQRVFSEEDEIHLLKAFLEITQQSPNPATAAPLLYERVGKSLSGEINQTQLIEKLRKLRQKYTKQVVDKLWIKNPHEREIFEISNKIWGENPSQRNSKGSPKASRRASAKKKAEPKDVLADVENEEFQTLPVVSVDLEKNYSFLMEEVAQFHGNALFKEGLKCLDGSELGRFNERWRLQQIAEAEISAQRAELIHEQTKLILEAVASSSQN